MRYFCVLITFASAAFAQWPTPKSAMDAYDFVQERRKEAGKLWEAGDPRGIAMLKETLPYLEQPLVRDLAAGNRYLEARRANIYLDLAEAYARQGNTREALNYLSQAAAISANPEVVKYLKGEKAFDRVRDDPGFAAVEKKHRVFEQYWDSPALSTPYQEKLSEAEKLAGLSKFWSEVRYNFGYPEKLVEMDWDKMYLEWIPKVQAAATTAAYYRELMSLCARLSDGHTNVYPPQQADVLSKPPLRTGLIEGHVMVLEVTSPSLEAKGIHAGSEILAVDGEPVMEYARREVEPYQSAATPQDRETRTYWYGFLRGPAAQPVRLKLRGADGKESEVEAPRRGFNDLRRRAPVEWRILPEVNIAYVALNDFGVEDVRKQWAAALPSLSGTAGMILDIRLNGGGSSGIGYEVLRSLVDHPVPGSRQVMRRYNPTDRARGVLMDWTELAAEDIQPRGGAPYKQPVVVLTSAATYSAAEDFLVAWKNSGRGVLIGEPSGGSTGQPLFFKLPGGGTARVCTKRDTFPDGREWVGKGIEPDILVHPTVADVRAGRDTVLEKAIDHLRKQAQ